MNCSSAKSQPITYKYTCGANLLPPDIPEGGKCYAGIFMGQENGGWRFFLVYFLSYCMEGIVTYM